MTLLNLQLEPLRHIIRNLRKRDADEVFAMSDADADGIADQLFQRRDSGVAWIAWVHNEPVAAFGAYRTHGAHYGLWMIATESWPKVRLGVTRFGVKLLIPFLFDNGMKVGNCLSLSDYPQMHKWIRMIGGVEDCDLKMFGKNGENFKRFIWINPLNTPNQLAS